MNEINVSRLDMIHLLSEAVQIGYMKASEDLGKRPKYISQNKAYNLFRKSRVENWVNEGLITGQSNGNGKTSTVYYDVSKLKILDTSDKIVIKKPYYGKLSI